jgi:hypothetical protein
MSNKNLPAWLQAGNKLRSIINDIAPGFCVVFATFSMPDCPAN